MTIQDLSDRESRQPPAAAGGPPSVFLVGMMGAGKTTIGRQLATALGREFVDLDQAIEQRCGVRIATIFDIEGEAGFRARETAILKVYSQRGNLIVATGGGVVVADENRRILRERGLVIYLRAGVDELFRRVARDRNRPLLQAEDPRQRLAGLLAQREALYLEVADLTLDTARQPVARAVRLLREAILAREAAPAPQAPAVSQQRT